MFRDKPCAYAFIDRGRLDDCNGLRQYAAGIFVPGRTTSPFFVLRSINFKCPVREQARARY